jgi:glycosyltransferase involved in cell wall biosynthesis
MEQAKMSMLKGIQYRMIPNGIDLEIFKPQDQDKARSRLGLPSNAGIVMLSAQTQFKDYTAMLNSLRELKTRLNNELLFLCFGKKGEDHSVGEGRIIFPGFERDPLRMALYYSASDIFLHSAKAEAFGKTIIEAMACGTPVVATAVGGIPELLKDGIAGYLVSVSNNSAMTQRMQHLLDDKSIRKKMGDRAASIVRHRFDLNRQVDDFLSWYEEILDFETNRNALPNSK